jgi:DNA helicase II / ATP-dependent DNA helicase PcrA
LKMNLYVSRSMVTTFEKSETTGNVFDAFIRSVDLRNNQIKKLEAYKKGYQVIPEMRPMRVIQLIRNDLGYEAALKSRAEKFGFRFDSLLSILDTLEGIAAPLRTMVEFANQLKELETAVQNAKFNPPENAVTLSTFHSSKGLEFRRVFMIDLVKGIIPSEDDEGSDATLEEARRLFYVGMTRAKERLELLTYRQDNGKAEEDSRFLYEVRRLLVKPKELMADSKSVQVSKKINFKVPINPNGIQMSKELTIGMKVKHRVFGHGEINDLKDQEISIQFEKMERRFDLETILSLGLLEKVAL